MTGLEKPHAPTWNGRKSSFLLPALASISIFLCAIQILSCAPDIEPPTEEIIEVEEEKAPTPAAFDISAIPIATGSPVKGIDVSHFQNEVDWNAVANTGRFAFAYIKATEGIDAPDGQFTANWQGAREAGLLRGAYHFYEPPDDPTEQANFFLQTVGSLGPGDLPPALDVEVTRDVDNETIIQGIQTWLDVVEKATGRKPLIYSGVNFWNALGTDAFGAYPLWLAEYGTDAPTIPSGWSAWTFWQYDDAGTVPGIDTEADLDLFAGSLEELTALADLPSQ